MTIVYPRTIPVPIESSRFGMNFNKTNFTGEFTRNRVSQSHAAGTTDRWEGVFTTPILSPAAHREMTAWLNAMSDDDGTFYAYNPDHQTPSGSISGAVTISGAGQTGKSVTVATSLLSTTGVFKAGDYIGFGGQFFEVKSDVDTDASGIAVVSILPAIRTAPANGATVTYNSPVMTAQLVKINHPQDTDHRKTGVISFAWQEKL